MASVKLTDVVNATREKYATYDIELPDGSVVVMENVIRLSDEALAEVQKLQAQLDVEDEEDSTAALRAIRRMFELTMTSGDYEALIAVVGNDRPTLIQLISEYAEATQVGEASPSES